MSQVPPHEGGQDTPAAPFTSPSSDNPPPPDPPQLPGSAQPPPEPQEATASGTPEESQDEWGTGPAHLPDWEAAPYPQQAPAAPPAFAPEDQRIPKGPAKARRWWLAGLALVLLAVIGVLIWLAVRPSADARPAQITAPTDVLVSALEVGDCVEPMPAADAVTRLTLVPCAQYHSAQVVDSVSIPTADQYPGQSKLSSTARTECSPAFEKYLPQVVQLAETPITPGITVILPSQQSWGTGDRTAWCVVYGVDGDFAGSLL